MLQLLLLGLGLSRLACAAPCFSDAVPVAQRKNIFFDGQEMPVGLWKWPGSKSRVDSCQI
ncbi:unnamed protein product [Cladocopium goreaui]|uniref:Uncharacterized protein n=1 Tax=Cladocopium goreaui TaxID=2562237 RepID=A0A9P1FI14_9DINO|nr:unnamed protein product [Cladocopium goreaui]